MMAQLDRHTQETRVMNTLLKTIVSIAALVALAAGKG